MSYLDISSDNLLLIEEEINDVAVNLATTYENIVAYLWDVSDTLIDKWSRETQSGYRTIYVIDNYSCEFYIYRGLISTMKNKKVHLEIKVIKSVASRDLDDDLEHTLYEGDFSVSESKMENDA
jgi:hypothetical protein